MSGLEALYQQIILEHSKARHGAVAAGAGLGSVTVPQGAVSAESHQLNPVCGDEITVRLDLRGEQVEGMAWDGAGCAISMASASVLSDLIAGMERAQALELMAQFRQMLRSRGHIAPDEDVLGEAAAFAGVARYVARVKCAMLAWVAAEDALDQLAARTD